MKLFHRLVATNSSQLYHQLLQDTAIRSVLKGEKVKSVLDVGTGSGISIIALLNINPKLTIKGLDIENSVWPEYSPLLKVTVYDGEKFPFRNKSFDLIQIILVLHHCKNLQSILRESRRVSKKFIFVVEEVRGNFIQNALLTLYDMIINLFIFNHFIQKPRFKTKSKLEKEFHNANLDIVQTVSLKKNILVRRFAYLLSI